MSTNYVKKHEQEKFEDIKRLIRSRRSKKNGQHNIHKENRSKGQTMFYKTLHRKVKID